MSLNKDLIESAVQYIKDAGTDGPPIDEILDFLVDEYAEALADVGERAKREYVRSIVRNGLKQREEMAEAQTSLPGFEVPGTITVPVREGRTIYVAFENATYEQAHAHVLMKENNIARAIEEKNKYDELLRQLDTEWEKQKHLPAGEIMRILRGELGLT